MILSIDVGIRNLAMCLLDDKNGNLVREWDVSGVPPEHKDGVYVSLLKHLDERPWVLSAKTILIEKQPDRNKKNDLGDALPCTHTLSSGVPKLRQSFTMLVTRSWM